MRVVRAAAVVAAVGAFAAEVSAQPVPDDRHDFVAGIQRALAERGFDPGPVDGIEGPSTAAAIRRYQADAGLPVDCAASAALYRRLYAEDRESDDDVLPAAEPAPATVPEVQETTDVDGTNGTGAQSVARAAPVETVVPDEVAPGQTGAASDPLIGTSWTFIDEIGTGFTGRFDADRGFTGPGDPRFWRWERIDEGVKITFDNRMGTRIEREGRLVDDDWLNGTARASDGSEWNWAAERIAPEESGTPPARN